MPRIVLPLILITTVVSLLLFAGPRNRTTITPFMQKTDSGFAVLELYTSQGCSSCPAADEVLSSIAAMHNPRIIPIAFHVDYWNRLGWTDPFSKAVFSDRQRHYAAQFGTESIYTPQLIVNGTAEMVGSDTRKVEAAISRALTSAPAGSIAINRVTVTGQQVQVSCTAGEHTAGQQLRVILLQHRAVTSVKAGENKNAELVNTNIARDLQQAVWSGSGASATLSLPVGLHPAECSIVVMLQDEATGRIAAVQQQAL